MLCEPYLALCSFTENTIAHKVPPSLDTLAPRFLLDTLAPGFLLTTYIFAARCYSSQI